MRPPQFAGEDEEVALPTDADAPASMRPPQFAGEDVAAEVERGQMDVASMRPPQFAGEDRPAPPPSRRARPCFNEAPAVRGGR